jgi:glycosyltransferase involved in cell wall biosynthesis
METSLRIQEQPVVFPLRFLVQGNVSMGRGFDELLYCWSQLEDDRAVLVLRCPENPYFEELLEKYDPLIRTGMVLIAEPVKESQLVEAASFADVGIIPYGGPSLNHVYACPNKLSQYMQAGLAILHHADQEYVSQVIQLHRCGLSYNPANPETLKKAVRQLIDNPLELATLKRNAYRAARSEFNWQVQSKPYLDSIMKFYGS